MNLLAARWNAWTAALKKDEPVDVVIRPEDVDIVGVDAVPIHGVVDTVTFKGVHYEIIVDVDGFKWMVQTTDYAEPGAVVGLRILPHEIHVMKKIKVFRSLRRLFFVYRRTGCVRRGREGRQRCAVSL